MQQTLSLLSMNLISLLIISLCIASTIATATTLTVNGGWVSGTVTAAPSLDSPIHKYYKFTAEQCKVYTVQLKRVVDDSDLTVAPGAWTTEPNAYTTVSYFNYQIQPASGDISNIVISPTDRFFTVGDYYVGINCEEGFCVDATFDIQVTSVDYADTIPSVMSLYGGESFTTSICVPSVNHKVDFTATLDQAAVDLYIGQRPNPVSETPGWYAAYEEIGASTTTLDKSTSAGWDAGVLYMTYFCADELTTASEPTCDLSAVSVTTSLTTVTAITVDAFTGPSLAMGESVTAQTAHDTFPAYKVTGFSPCSSVNLAVLSTTNVDLAISSVGPSLYGDVDVAAVIKMDSMDGDETFTFIPAEVFPDATAVYVSVICWDTGEEPNWCDAGVDFTLSATMSSPGTLTSPMLEYGWDQVSDGLATAEVCVDMTPENAFTLRGFSNAYPDVRLFPGAHARDITNIDQIYATPGFYALGTNDISINVNNADYDFLPSGIWTLISHCHPAWCIDDSTAATSSIALQVKLGDDTLASACPPGQTVGTSGFCAPCAPGTVEMGGYCVSCPAGSVAATAGLSGPDSCEMCAEGTSANASGTACDDVLVVSGSNGIIPLALMGLVVVLQVVVLVAVCSKRKGGPSGGMPNVRVQV